MYIWVVHISSVFIYSYCRSRNEKLLPLLLPDEQSEAVINMTIEISLRLAQEKVHQWINKHITFSESSLYTVKPVFY